MTQIDCSNPSNDVRILRATIFGVLAGYAVLLGLLFVFHETPMAMMKDMGPFFIVGGLGLAFAIGPLLFPNLQNRLRITGRGLGKACAHQSLSLQRAFGIMAMGMTFGALLHQTVKLFFG